MVLLVMYSYSVSGCDINHCIGLFVLNEIYMYHKETQKFLFYGIGKFKSRIGLDWKLFLLLLQAVGVAVGCLLWIGGLDILHAAVGNIL